MTKLQSDLELLSFASLQSLAGNLSDGITR
jgi:hypothetical protein